MKLLNRFVMESGDIINLAVHVTHFGFRCRLALGFNQLVDLFPSDFNFAAEPLMLQDRVGKYGRNQGDANESCGDHRTHIGLVTVEEHRRLRLW